jgi:hypothetical protein
MITDIEKLAYWSWNNWSGTKLLEIFGNKYVDCLERKFNSDILKFYLSLDKNERKIFEEYMEKTLEVYNPFPSRK